MLNLKFDQKKPHARGISTEEAQAKR